MLHGDILLMIDSWLPLSHMLVYKILNQHPSASSDKCTLYNDRNLINRRNVVTDVSKNVSACKKFFLLEVKARVVAAAMNELGIEDIDSSPDSESFNINENDSREKKINLIHSLATTVVNTYILKEARVQGILDKIHNATGDENCNMKGERYLCRFPGCTKSFRHDGKRRQDHEKSHTGMALNKSPVGMSAKEKDDMFN